MRLDIVKLFSYNKSSSDHLTPASLLHRAHLAVRSGARHGASAAAARIWDKLKVTAALGIVSTFALLHLWIFGT